MPKTKRPPARIANVPQQQRDLLTLLERLLERSAFGSIGEPEAVTRARRVSTQCAAEFLGLSNDAFMQTYPHLVEKVSRRLNGVRVGRLLDL
jgi:hypothetical protein